MDGQAPMLRAILIAVCAWSFGVLLVVESGLGARYALHPDNPLQAGDVPAVALNRAQSTVGDLAAYAEVGARPLFDPERRPPPPPPVAPAEQPAPPAPLNVVLTSIIISGDKRIAIVSDRQTNKAQTLRVGQSLAGDQSAWKLVELEPRRAVFEGPGGRNALDLRVFDGQGGEPPTPVVVATVPAADPNAAGGANPLLPGAPQAQAAATPGAAEGDTPEARAEMIRRRIEERRRQMREEAARLNAESGK